MQNTPSQSHDTPTSGGQQPIVGVRSREELREVSKAQRGLLICLLVQILLYVFLQLSNLGGQAGAQPGSNTVQLGLGLILFIFGVGGMVYTFRIARLVSGMAMGILLTVLSVIPCLGLLVLLLVNGKATNILKANGITVGFLGCDANSI